MDAWEDASVYSQVIVMLSTGLNATICSASNTAVTSIASTVVQMPQMNHSYNISQSQYVSFYATINS